MLGGAFTFLQKIGKALMMPVAVLPVAGLLLGIGAAEFPFLPETVSALMKLAGEAIFDQLPLLFAIAIALGFTRNDGYAALSAAIGYAVLLATMKGMAAAGSAPEPAVGILTMDTGVFGGILAGALASATYGRFHAVRLPDWLRFFGGKRLVPILTALGALVLGIVLSAVWPSIEAGIGRFSHWAAVSDPRTAATLYGFVERLLVPFGLHHIWNVPFFFEIGSFEAGGRIQHGDIARFFAGDPTAGILGGAYFFKMFGLPGAAFAIWRTARPESRLRVAGLMLPAALTSFVTGITEPIEFAFLFAAPVLYLIHALLAASAQFVGGSLDMHLGFTFSQGGIDLVLFNLLGRHGSGAWLVLLIGPLYGLVYFAVFRFAIRRWDLRTPGREHTPAATAAPPPADPDTRSRDLVLAFGGETNITGLDACITRLRLTVEDPSRIDAHRLAELGATGVVIGGNGVQAVFGPASEDLKSDLEEYLRGAAGAAPPVARAEAPQVLALQAPLPLEAPSLRALGAVAPGAGRWLRSVAPTVIDEEAPAGQLDTLIGLEAAATLARIARDQDSMAEDLALSRNRERELERNLAHGQRLASLGRVVAGIAHEVRNPITGIKLTLDGLLRRGLDERSTDDVAVCVDEIGRLDRLVGSLLLVARAGADQKRPLDLAELADQRLRQARGLADTRGVRLERHGAASVQANPDSIARVIDNLLRNAIEASPPGGTVHLRLEVDAAEAHLHVVDDGPGLPPDREHQLFEPFFTLSSEGTGLGLFLSRALVVAQGGRLVYTRAAATTFTASLPLEAPEGDRAPHPHR